MLSEPMGIGVNVRHRPLHRLRRPIREDWRPIDSGLVLVVASEREIRRERLRKLASWICGAAIASLVISVSLTLWHADDADRIPALSIVDASGVSALATPLPGFSVRLEPRGTSFAGPEPQRDVPALRIDGELRRPVDRGY